MMERSEDVLEEGEAVCSARILVLWAMPALGGVRGRFFYR
jgi:hypothetical protein